LSHQLEKPPQVLKLQHMFKNKLTWKRPLFFLLLPIFLIMILLGFPMPVAPPPALKAGQEQSVKVKKRKRHKLFKTIQHATDDESN
jgi:hypothetical protein